MNESDVSGVLGIWESESSNVSDYEPEGAQGSAEPREPEENFL